MNVAERIRALRTVNGLSIRQLAALADIAPSTITRIEAGQMSPTSALVENLLGNLGATVVDRPIAEPAASAAARTATDPTYNGAQPAKTQSILDSWSRIGLIDSRGAAVEGKQADVLFRAGRLDRLQYRDAASTYLPAGDWAEIADRLYGDPTLDWALTSGAAANQWVNVGGDQPAVFYVSDLDQAAAAAQLTPTPDGYLGERVTFIGFNGIWETGRTIETDGMRLASRTQVAIDCYGGALAGPTQADALLGRWL